MATGTWAFRRVKAIAEEKVTREAVLLIGPVLGAPYLAKMKEGARMMVPVLIEVDRDVEVSLLATDLFSGKQLSLSIHLSKNSPKVLKIGPLHGLPLYSRIH